MPAERAPLRFTIAAGLVAAAALGYGLFSTRRAPTAHGPAQARTSQGEMEAIAPSSAAPSPISSSSALPAVTHAPASAGLASLAELRELLTRAPEQALSRARASNAASPNDPDAPERAWIAVRSLDDLRRYHEAQAEARELVRRYPGTRFADDVERHVLSYPLDQPSREAQQAAAERASRRRP